MVIQREINKVELQTTPPKQQTNLRLRHRSLIYFVLSCLSQWRHC